MTARGFSQQARSHGSWPLYSLEKAYFPCKRHHLMKECPNGLVLPIIPGLHSRFKHSEECLRRTLLRGCEQHAHVVHRFSEPLLSECYADQRPQARPLVTANLLLALPLLQCSSLECLSFVHIAIAPCYPCTVTFDHTSMPVSWYRRSTCDRIASLFHLPTSSEYDK